MSKKRVPIPGSDRKPLPGAQVIGPTNPDVRAEVTLRLRPRKGAGAVVKAALKMAEKLPRERKYLTREEYAPKCGADLADLKAIDDFSRAHNLTIVDTNIAGRTVRLNGSVGDLNTAFGVQLQQFQVADLSYRGRTGKITVPESVSGIIEAVYGLDNRQVAKPHYRVLDTTTPPLLDEGSFALGDAIAPAEAVPAAGPKNAPDGSFKVPDLSKLYNFPAGLDGRGQCIALIELNDTDTNGNPTGTGFALSDLNTYFQSIGLATPSVVAVGVDGGANVPGPDPGTDGEVAPNTTAGFIDAVNAALHDTIRKPSLISISWGGPEDGSPQQFLDGMSRAFSDAAALGVTICTASGDNGSADEDPQTWDKKLHVDFPSSIPFALACGGTKLLGSGTSINSEVVWNEGTKGGATGGGVSNIFPKPSYQAKAKVPVSPLKKSGRGVPDVAADADPFTGYQVFVGGKAAVFGGTSAVAPLWAGLIALINQRLAARKGNNVGFLNPLLYGKLLPTGVLNDIISGNNDIFGSSKGLYKAGRGWDPCTGLGSPNGAKLLKALGG